jgi:hypothetical protein
VTNFSWVERLAIFPLYLILKGGIMATLNNFPLFTELARKQTLKGVMCFDRFWDGEHKQFQHVVSVNYKPMFQGTENEMHDLFKAFKEQSNV